jgi:hypothetical protein
MLAFLGYIILVSVTIAAAASRAGHDIFFECIEIAKINRFNLEFHILIELHDESPPSRLS